jgi:hypothetical protein
MILILLGLLWGQGKPAQALTPPPTGGILLRYDFNGTALWPARSAASSGPGVHTIVTAAPVGTIDVAGSTQPSGGLLLSARGIPAGRAWSAGLFSGRLPVHCGLTTPTLLTLSFSLSASSVRPVTVQIESFDRAHRRTGGLEGQVFPAAPDFFQRYALDLCTMHAFGPGRFRPTDPFVQLRFGVRADPMVALPAARTYRLCLDNVNYAAPAYYVRPQGSDSSDGRTVGTAFATPQKALDVAQPGDIILLMDGTYQGGASPAASFPRPGLPDAWIVLKNYPGQHPLLTAHAWNIVSITQGASSAISQAPPLAYLEVRGLHVRGEGDVARQKYPEAMDKPDPRTNSNGIAVDGRYSAATYHDFRIADNLIEYSPACGIGVLDSDWVTVEGNVCRSNCWTTIYATSGISVMGPENFDGTVNVYKKLVRDNVCCHNQTYEKWTAINNYSDGNGIILDVNQGSAERPTVNYMGRTLVQSNLCYDNGGSGIHTVTADRVDVINNTAYHNSASVHLEYSEMFSYGSQDVHFINNILVAPVANVAAGEKPEPVNKGYGTNTNVTFSHNVYFGGNIAPTLGDGDVIADPQFVQPSIDDKTANFHLKPGSPALGKGIIMPFSPLLDLDGKTRANPPSEGGYEK